MPVRPRDKETGTPRTRRGLSATKPGGSERATPTSTRSEWRTLVLATGALLGAGLSMLLAGCGGDGGSPAAPPPPPPPQPLGWNGLPDEITVQVAETATFNATLTAAVDANYTISASTGAVEVSGEAVRAGGFRGSVTGVEAGEVEVTVTASQPGFVTATASFDVIVEDLFDLSLWRELVFDAFDCPNGFTDESCRNRWGERDVENRITAVLPFAPDFHLVSPGRGWRFTSAQEDTISDAIRAAVKQITGQEFVGRITTGRSLKDHNGWVDIIAVENDFWERPRGPCGAAGIGRTEGIALINVERLDDCGLYPVAMHEVGHALGFFHVLNLGDFMMSPILAEIPPVFSEGEQFHAQLAWELGRGAPYTPDPRKTSSSTRLTLDTRSSRGGLENLPLKEMVQCPSH